MRESNIHEIDTICQCEELWDEVNDILKPVRYQTAHHDTTILQQLVKSEGERRINKKCVIHRMGCNALERALLRKNDIGELVEVCVDGDKKVNKLQKNTTCLS